MDRTALLQMDWKAFAEAVKNPETQMKVVSLMKGDKEVIARVNEMLLARQNATTDATAEVEQKIETAVPPSTEELAAQAAAVAATPEPVAPAPPTPPVVPDYTEEDKAWATEGVKVTRDAKGKVIRLVQDYQVKDTDGSSIGRPTHLEATSAQQLLTKQREAHEEAVRFGYRMKRQQLTFKQNEQNRLLKPEEIDAVATKALEAKDAAEVGRIVRSVIENEFKTREQKVRTEYARLKNIGIGLMFMQRHLHDYNPVDANHKALEAWLHAHEMEFTLDNLEIALADLKDQPGKLAPLTQSGATRPAEQVNEPVTATPEVVAADSTPVVSATPEVTTTAVAQPEAASQPTVEATATTPAAATNSQPAARRPGVNGSLPPGTLSAKRPEAADPNAARKEFMRELKNMKPDVLKKRLKMDPQFVKECESYGIRVR